MTQDTEIIGQVIGSQFRILKRLGEGGMGAVFLAEQMEMERKVVVKVLHPELTASNSSAIERFRREAKAVAQLNHPNIVQVFVFGQADNGQLYLAMEFIEGRDLAKELSRGPMPQPRALKILDQVCAALTEAHGAGIVHRDLKPENIMLADRHGNSDFVKVLDFGIAKLHEPGGGNSPKLTQAGTVFGTPRYMSPEQVKGESVDARSDIYALGVIFYEMLCGRHPFDAETTIEYLVKHVNESVPLPSEVFAELELMPRVEALVMKCLEKSPEDRFQSVAELQRELRTALRDFSESTRGFPSQPPSEQKRGKQVTQSKKSDYRPPGSGPEGRKGGMPTWGWVLIALLLAGGLTAGVMTLLSRKEGGTSTKTDRPETQEASKTEDTSGGDEPPAKPKPIEKEASADTTGDGPTTSIPEGRPIDDFPMPREITLTSSSPQAEMFETPLTPAELIGFYKAKLHGRYTLKDSANGLVIEDPKSPFTSITFSAYGDRYFLMLARNVMIPAKKGEPIAPAFGVEFPAEATLIMRSPQAVIVRSRQPFAAICDFYTNKYGNIKNVVAARDIEAAQPYCTLAGAAVEGIEWSAISVTRDPTSPGALMITIAARMF